MAELVKDLMTEDPRCVNGEATAEQAAKEMRDCDCGDVLVTGAEGQIQGIVTDRDIVVRAIAEGLDPAECAVSEICSEELEVLSPDDSLKTAIEKMNDHAVKRLPVVEGGTAVGILSLGDLAADRDPGSVLGAISQAESNL